MVNKADNDITLVTSKLMYFLHHNTTLLWRISSRSSSISLDVLVKWGFQAWIYHCNIHQLLLEEDDLKWVTIEKNVTYC